jgi:ABC-type glycerol-3-phosphate transport system substrate-binding protein
MVDKIKAAGYEPISTGFLGGAWVGHYRSHIMQRVVPEDIYYGLAESWDPVSTSTASWTDPVVIEAHEYMVEIYEKCYAEGNLGRDWAQGRSLFLNGTALMHAEGTWEVSIIESEKPEGFEYGWFQYPQIKEEIAPKILHFTGNCIVIPKGGPNVDLAKKLVALMSTKESAITLASQGQIPIRTDIDSDTISELLGETMAGIYNYAAENGSIEAVETLASAELANKGFTLAQEMLAGTITPEECCQEMEAMYEAARE